MHTVLFVATMPTQAPREGNLEWKRYISLVGEKVSAGAAVQRLGENVWLVNMTLEPSALAYLTSIAADQNIAYGILPFRHAPEWLPADFDPKPTRGRSE